MKVGDMIRAVRNRPPLPMRNASVKGFGQMQSKIILVIGTYDTKDEELSYISSCIRAQALPMGGAEICSIHGFILSNHLH